MASGLTRRQKRLQKQAIEDARAILSHKPTMRFLCNVLDRCGYFEDQFTGNSETFYRLGQRRTGKDMVDMLRLADDDALIRVLEVAKEERAKNAPQNEAKDESDDD